ncbi:DUF802 domain-containing protein [Thauera butanivorans]|uniref:DUF802 domain-containing protein n=1 Tax=Thauera butanivorans TaxID=86174 RepID=UPI0008385E8A|nr:DUF802 domain-containing protein [Thauera butanivorans]
MNRSMSVAAFLLGGAVVVWVGAGYVGRSPLALGMTVLIGLVYLAGTLELLRFERATAALRQALGALPAADAGEGAGAAESSAVAAGFERWLGGLPVSLRNAVRLRVEGERIGLPGPALTPYLVGMLVLLGMLGTFLGMVMTLDGAVAALETTTDLQTIRASLAAPVKGLGVAFGTSVAGVAASAMLGLMSALCRRARMQASQLLDARIAGELRGASLAHQRQKAFAAIEQQARTLPALVDSLQAMMVQMERQGRELNEHLTAGQQRFHDEARSAYSALAASVDTSLKHSLTESARLAGQTIQPVVADTMAGIARETAALQQRVADGVQAQLDGVAQRLDQATTRVADTWTAALARHEADSEAMGRRLDASHAAWAEEFAQRAAALLASVGDAHAGLLTELAAATEGIARHTTELHMRVADALQARFDGLAARFDAGAGSAAEAWVKALAGHEHSSRTTSAELRQALQAFADTFAQRSAGLVEQVGTQLSALQAELAAQDAARQAAQAQALDAMAAALRDEWRQAGEQAGMRQQDVLARLEETARSLSAATQEQASRTIEQVGGLLQTAAEAPRAAAEVIGELRQELSASIARDNAALAERSRIMETLGGLLDAINHASTEQRQAIDALVASSASALERAGAGFAQRIEAESLRLDETAGQIAGGAVEVASLAEAFGLAVQLFSESNDKLMAGLQRIESALEKSMTRSDEQLAYYVAQAREIIDLSLMSQQRIVEDLRQRPAGAPAGEA